MKSRSELQKIIDEIASTDSPVGMDALYVHALILDQLSQIDQRLRKLEATVSQFADRASQSG